MTAGDTENDTDDNDDGGNGDADNNGGDVDMAGVLTIAPIPNQTYTGKALKPEVVVAYGRDILQLGRDYTITYKNNTNAAKADATKAPVAIVKGKGNYAGTVTLTFNILAKEMTEKNTVVSEMIFNENGKVQAVKPTVTVAGKKLAAADAAKAPNVVLKAKVNKPKLEYNGGKVKFRRALPQ